VSDEYGLLEPFDTKDLAGADAELAFALGVEWELFRQKLLAGEPFTDVVLLENIERITRMVERHGRFVEWHHFCKDWAKIIVGGEKTSF
jgi:ABC-type Zn2+ transport system substrate-binding protein/surface adhesin